MNTSLHTPGPWYTNARPTDTQGLVYAESTGENIAVTYDPKNARLIAAAPDLLAALQAVAGETGCFETGPRPYSGDSYLPEKFKEAIRAALLSAQ